MSVEDAIWEALTRRADDAEDLARVRRIREDREHADQYQLGDPSRFVPGRIDNQRKRKGKP